MLPLYRSVSNEQYSENKMCKLQLIFYEYLGRHSVVMSCFICIENCFIAHNWMLVVVFIVCDNCYL